MKKRKVLGPKQDSIMLEELNTRCFCICFSRFSASENSERLIIGRKTVFWQWIFDHSSENRLRARQKIKIIKNRNAETTCIIVLPIVLNQRFLSPRSIFFVIGVATVSRVWTRIHPFSNFIVLQISRFCLVLDRLTSASQNWSVVSEPPILAEACQALLFLVQVLEHQPISYD